MIETARLRLRGHVRGDLDACLAMWSDPEVIRFISGRASTEQQTWARILTYIGHWQLMGFGYWVIEEKQTGDFVGEGGFADFKRDIDESMRAFPELGFALASRFHGKGYATQAVRAALSWADANLPFARTVALINSENVASQRVVQKCGYGPLQEGGVADQPTLFFTRARASLTKK